MKSVSKYLNSLLESSGIEESPDFQIDKMIIPITERKKKVSLEKESKILKSMTIKKSPDEQFLNL